MFGFVLLNEDSENVIVISGKYESNVYEFLEFSIISTKKILENQHFYLLKQLHTG
jgi:hypothetical protein